MSQQLYRIFPLLRTLDSTWCLRFEVDQMSLTWDYVHTLLLTVLAVPTSLTCHHMRVLTSETCLNFTEPKLRGPFFFWPHNHAWNDLSTKIWVIIV